MSKPKAFSRQTKARKKNEVGATLVWRACPAHQQDEKVPETANDYLEAIDELEEAGQKWRAGDGVPNRDRGSRPWTDMASKL